MADWFFRILLHPRCVVRVGSEDVVGTKSDDVFGEGRVVSRMCGEEESKNTSVLWICVFMLVNMPKELVPEMNANEERC